MPAISGWPTFFLTVQNGNKKIPVRALSEETCLRRANDRKVLSGIIYVIRNGLDWSAGLFVFVIINVLNICVRPPVIKDFNDDPIVDRLVQFVRSEKATFRPMIDPFDLFRTVYVAPRKLHMRISAQDGAFLVFGILGKITGVNEAAALEVEKS